MVDKKVKPEFPTPTPGKDQWPWIASESAQVTNTLGHENLPLISVVTPSFNQAEFLEETIRSVLLQGYPNLEYYVIDGGSTDGSVEIIKRYEPWLNYWISEKDTGQSQAINKGWRKASGEILSWLNSDDYLLPGTLLRIAEVFRSNPRAGLVHGKVRFINSSGESTGDEYGSEFNLESSLLKSQNPVAQPATFISRTALNTVGGLNENLHMSMDWDLWLRIATLFPVVYLPEFLATFRTWPGAKSSTIRETSSPEHLEIVKKWSHWSKKAQVTTQLRRKALAISYSRSAVHHHRKGNLGVFRSQYFKSLILCPTLSERYGKDLIPELLLGRKISDTLVSLKHKLQPK